MTNTNTTTARVSTVPADATGPRAEVARHAESLGWTRVFSPVVEYLVSPEGADIEITVQYFSTGRIQSAAIFREVAPIDGQRQFERLAYVGATKAAQATVIGWLDGNVA